MSDETILSGYCRVLDQSRMVTVEWEGQSLLDADCCYGACVAESTATIDPWQAAAYPLCRKRMFRQVHPLAEHPFL